MRQRRVLVINAPSTTDYARVGGILREYEGSGKLDGRPGRYNLTAYAQHDDYSDVVSVWHTATQVTIHFGDKK